MKPYFDEGGIAIFNADCRDVLPCLAAGSIDLVFTSPPYNLGNTTGGGFPEPLGHYRKSSGLSGRGGQGKWSGAAIAHGYGAHSDDMEHEDYVAWQNEVIDACWRLLSPAGAIYYNHKPRVLGGQLVSPLAYIPADLMQWLRQIVIWKRSGGVNFTPAFYLPMHEWIVILARRDFRLTSQGAAGIGDVWTVHQDIGNPHPAPFPIGLPERAIETTPSKVILDPFMGSGTTLVAAKRLGRRAIGVELNEDFCRMAVQRLQQEVLHFDSVEQVEQRQSFSQVAMLDGMTCIADRD